MTAKWDSFTQPSNLPVAIHTVPHVPWQQQNLRLPRAMQEEATEHVREKLANGTLEFSQGQYRSRYFLVEKKQTGSYRFINDVQPLNKVTIRDSGMPPSVDEFSEDFAGYLIVLRSITTLVLSDSSRHGFPLLHCFPIRSRSCSNEPPSSGIATHSSCRRKI